MQKIKDNVQFLGTMQNAAGKNVLVEGQGSGGEVIQNLQIGGTAPTFEGAGLWVEKLSNGNYTIWVEDGEA